MTFAPRSIVVVLALLAGVAALKPARATTVLRRITICSVRSPSVPNGESLRCEGDRIRLDGVDAPAVGGWNRRGEPYARDAKKLLTRLTRGLVSCDMRRDQSGEWVARCWTDETPDLGAAMIRSGFAVQDGRHDYAAEEADARAAGRGVWASPPPETGSRPAT